MNYHNRTIEATVQTISQQFPVLLLTGPRQVGKTTMLRQLCQKTRKYVSLDDPRLREMAKNDPPLFLSRHQPPLLIDEIQYAPELLPYIKMMVDEKRTPGLIWLTGSQQFHMMKNISESLAGRVGILNMLGFSRHECYQHDTSSPFLPTSAGDSPIGPMDILSVYRDIWQGSFPELIAGSASPDRDIFYSSYLQTYLQRDIRDLTQVTDELAFLRFIRACAARTGQLLNMADIARDVDISIPTVKRWLSILQACYQIYLLQPLHRNITKRLVKTPKIYFLDTGLCSYLTEWTSPESLEAGAMSGSIFETYVFSELLKSYWHNGKTPILYYYRDQDTCEIDFVLSQDNTLYPIEVKKSATPRKSWCKHFKVLENMDMNVGQGAVISLIDKPFPLDQKNTAIPIQTI